MPLLFSYGSLRHEDVQMSAFGRRVEGTSAEVLGYERRGVDFANPARAAAHRACRYETVIPVNGSGSKVEGIALEITDLELADADRYEALDNFTHIAVVLASGHTAWMYVHGNTPT